MRRVLRYLRIGDSRRSPSACSEVSKKKLHEPVGVPQHLPALALAHVGPVALAPRAVFFFDISERTGGQREGPVPDLKVPKDVSHRDPSDPH